MRTGWLWPVALASPVPAGPLLVVLYPSDPVGLTAIVVGWPATALVAGLAMWFSVPAARWLARPLGALAAAIAMLVVSPFVLIVSYALAIVFFGDDDRTYS
jgi:hypothetical protein